MLNADFGSASERARMSLCAIGVALNVLLRSFLRAGLDRVLMQRSKPAYCRQVLYLYKTLKHF